MSVGWGGIQVPKIKLIVPQWSSDSAENVMMYFDSVSTETNRETKIWETPVVDILRNSEMLGYHSLHLKLNFYVRS